MKIDFRVTKISIVNNTAGLNGIQDEIEITSEDRKTLKARRHYAQQQCNKMNAEDPRANWVVFEWRE